MLFGVSLLGNDTIIAKLLTNVELQWPRWGRVETLRPG